MIRSFLALPVDGEAATAITRRQGEIPGARPVPEENLHLTLAFLGDQPEARLFDILPDIADIAGPAFDVTLGPPTLLGGKAARAIALVAAPNEDMTRLRAQSETVLRQAGLDLERRRFRPHVTLFRLPRTLDPATPTHIQRWLTAAATLPPVTFRAEELTLYRSILTPDGPVYDPLASIPLTTTAPAG